MSSSTHSKNSSPTHPWLRACRALVRTRPTWPVPGRAALDPQPALRIEVVPGEGKAEAWRRQRCSECCHLPARTSRPAPAVGLRVDAGRPGGNRPRPDVMTCLGLGKRKVDDNVDPADESLVDVLAKVRRQDDDAIVLFNTVQQVVNLHVQPHDQSASSTLPRLPKRASASSKKIITLGVLQPRQRQGSILLCLAYVLAHHGQQIF